MKVKTLYFHGKIEVHEGWDESEEKVVKDLIALGFQHVQIVASSERQVEPMEPVHVVHGGEGG